MAGSYHRPHRKPLKLIATTVKDTIRRRLPPEVVRKKVETAAYVLAFVVAVAGGLALLVIWALNALGWTQTSPMQVVASVVAFVSEEHQWNSGKGFWLDVAGAVVDHAGSAAGAALLLATGLWLLWAVVVATARHAFESVFTDRAFQLFVHDALAKHFGASVLGSRERFLSIAPIRLAGEHSPDIAWTTRDYRAWKELPGARAWVMNRLHRTLKWGTIRYPDRLGFSARAIVGPFEAFDVQACKYQEDQDTAYKLGFAYCVWYLRSRADREGRVEPDPAVRPRHLTRLYEDIADWRRKHLDGARVEAADMAKLLSDVVFRERGNGFAHVRTQLGVQALVLFRDGRDLDAAGQPRWKVVLQKRSPDVASSPNHFQFIPSGGFESHHQLREDGIDGFTQTLLQRQTNLELALMREFAEEVLGVDEFVSNENFDPAEVWREPGVFELTNLVREGKASMACLGVAMSLVGFKGEVSYVLCIDDPSYFVRHRLKRSEGEARVIFTWPLDALEDLLQDDTHPLVDASKTLLNLFVHDESWRRKQRNGYQPVLSPADVGSIERLRELLPAVGEPLQRAQPEAAASAVEVSRIAYRPSSESPRRDNHDPQPESRPPEP